MYAMKQSAPSVSTPRQHYSYLPLIIVAALLIVVTSALVAWKIYHNHQVAADKARFAQAERDISDLSRQIVAAAGQPAKTESDKYCSRPNLKLDKGPLSCDVEWVGFYPVATPEAATALFNSAKATSSSKWRPMTFRSLDNASDTTFDAIAPDTGQKDNYLRIIGRTRVNDMECSQLGLFYRSDELPFDGYLADSSSEYVLALVLSCGDYAKIQHYPMKS